MSSTSATAYAGGCLCKANRYEITPSNLPGIRVCHCLDCQKASGSAFMANIVVLQSEFRFVQGGTEDILGKFACRETLSGNEVVRNFCTKCGSPIYATLTGNNHVMVVMTGTLDKQNDEWKPVSEQFIRDRRSWSEDLKVEGIARYDAMGA